MRILLLGANGFIGAAVGARLIELGHDVAAGVRRPASFSHTEYFQNVDCDFAKVTDIDGWRERVRGYAAVVNCVGILRQSGRSSFQRVHIDTPAAIFAACAAEGVRRLVQISALGDPQATRFIDSKHQGDALLEASELEWTIFRPSVVYSPASSYGGTSLLRAMSVLPILALPGAGEQQLQPVALADLADAVAGALEDNSGVGKVIEVVGPEVISIREYLQAHRRWLGLSTAVTLRTPIWLTTMVAHMGEWLGRGPLGLTMLNMLSCGNVGRPGSAASFEQYLGRKPLSVAAALARKPASQADLWHARLYLLGPMLRIGIGLLWLLSGIVGWLTPAEMTRILLAEAGIAIAVGQWLIFAVSLLDILLGLAFLIGWQLQWVGGLMVLMLLGYSIFIGLLLPRIWIDPFGSLIKNIPLLPAILIAMALDQKR